MFAACSAIHAGIKELYVPFDHKPVVVESPPLHEVLDILNKKHCQCPTGSAAKTGGYRAMGTACVSFSNIFS